MQFLDKIWNVPENVYRRTCVRTEPRLDLFGPFMYLSILSRIMSSDNRVNKNFVTVLCLLLIALFFKWINNLVYKFHVLHKYYDLRIMTFYRNESW